MKHITRGAFFILVSLCAPVATFAAGPATVDLLSAGSFTIVSQTGITDTGSHSSSINGNIGSSPITAAAMDSVFCSEITGTMYGVDAAYVGSGITTCFAGNPPLSNKTLVDTAVLDMGTAYTDAAGRIIPDGVELYAGNLGGQTFTPGLYTWSTDVTIPTDVTLSGGANDVWIFQIAGNLDIASGASVPAGIKVQLQGGAQASNIFWQVGGVAGVTLGTYSTFNGNILAAKQIVLQTGAVLNGRALSQTQVTLDSNNVSYPVYIAPAVPVPVVVVSTSHSGGNNRNRINTTDPALVSSSVTAASQVNTVVTGALAVGPTLDQILAPIANMYPSFPDTGFSPKEVSRALILIPMGLLFGLIIFSRAISAQKRSTGHDVQ